MTFFQHFFRDYCKGDNVLWIVYLLLTYISIIEVYSASSALSFDSGDYLEPIRQHSITLILGMGVVLGIHRIHTRYFRLIPMLMLPLSVILLLIVMLKGMVMDARVNGAARWILGFQPSDMAKMALVASVAYILAKYRDGNGCTEKAMKPILIISAIVLALIAPENGSTALLLAVVVYLMMLIGGIPYKQMLKLTGTIALIATLGVTALITVPPTIYKDVPGTHRFVTWRNRILEYTQVEEIPPTAYDINKNAQIAHANIAIATSHVIGRGPGNSMQRDHLSHGYSDFIYAIIIEEMGLLGGLFVIYLYMVLMVRTGRIAKKCTSPYSTNLIIGLALLIVCQALLHMMVSVGLFPVTGQPLPLVSKGGTSIVFNCIYIGIILSVSRSAEKAEEAGQLESRETDDEG